MKLGRFTVLFAFCLWLSHAPFADDRPNKVKALMAEMAMQLGGENFINSLTAKGLSPADSEATVEAAFRGVASCLVDAALAQAEIESVPAEDVLNAIEKLVAVAGSPQQTDDRLTTGLLNEDAISRLAAPCLFAVAEKSGIIVE